MPFWKEPNSYREEIARFLFRSPVLPAFEQFIRNHLFFDWQQPLPDFLTVRSAIYDVQRLYGLHNEDDTSLDKSEWFPEDHYADFILIVHDAALEAETDLYPGAKAAAEDEWMNQLFETLVFFRHLWLDKNNLGNESGASRNVRDGSSPWIAH